MSVSHLGRSASRLLRIKYLIIPSDENDLLLWDADVLPKHPDYLRRIPNAKYDAQFSKVIKIYKPQEKSSKSITIYHHITSNCRTISSNSHSIHLENRSSRVCLSMYLSCASPDGWMLALSRKPPNMGTTTSYMKVYGVLRTLSSITPWPNAL